MFLNYDNQSIKRVIEKNNFDEILSDVNVHIKNTIRDALFEKLDSHDEQYFLFLKKDIKTLKCIKDQLNKHVIDINIIERISNYGDSTLF